MTSPVPDALVCPGCRAALVPGAARCASCGLALRGPAAARLWQVSVQISQLEDERSRLLDALRAPAAPSPADLPPLGTTGPVGPASQLPPPPGATPPAATPPPWASSPPAAWTPAAPPRPRKEWTPKRVQNLLLSLGVSLLAVAALIFTAYAWGRLGVTGRGLVLGTVTVAVGWAASRCLRRELVATAEALGTLAVVLTLLDAYAARRAGLAGLEDVHAPTYWAAALAVVALGSAGYTAVVPLRATRWAAAVGVQLPLPVLVADASHLADAARSGWLAAQSGVVVLAAARVRHRWPDVGALGLAGAGSAWVVSLGLAAHDAAAGTRVQAQRGALALAGTAAAAALTAWVWRHRDGAREAASATATALLVVAAVAAAHVGLPARRIPTVIAAAGFAAVLGAALLPRLWRRAPLAVGAASVVTAVVGVSIPVVTALVAPLGWAAQPWTRDAGGSARRSLSPDFAWDGSGDVLLVLLVAVVTAVLVSGFAGRREQGAPAVAVVSGVGVLLVPLGLDWAYAAAVGWDLAAGALLAAVAVPAGRSRPVLARSCYAAGVAVLGIALAWSLADDTATVVALAAIAALLVALAAADRGTRPVSAALAAAALCGEVAAVSLRADVDLVRVGWYVAVAAAVTAVAGQWLRGRDALLGSAVAGVGGGAYVVALGQAGTDSGWLAWVLLTGAGTSALLTFRERGNRALAATTAALACAFAPFYADGIGTPEARVGFVLVATAGATAAVARLLRQPWAAAVAGTAYAIGLAYASDDGGWLAWSLLLGTVVAAAGAASVRDRAPLAAAAAVLGCAWAGVLADSRGTPLDRTGFCVALAAGAALVAGALLRRDARASLALDTVGALAYALAVALTHDDLGWLSWTLALGGIAGLAESLRADRRWVGYAGGALVTSWSWTRLALEDVTAPEAYAAPLAATALVLGHLRRRQQPTMSSWVAYGSGLGVAFGPSLLLAIDDPGLARPLLLGLAALAVLVYGARERLQAPLVLGGATLLVDAVAQVGPYAAALPRWVSIAAAGLVLLLLGATFEQRRRDLDRMRSAFAAMD